MLDHLGRPKRLIAPHVRHCEPVGWVRTHAAGPRGQVQATASEEVIAPEPTARGAHDPDARLLLFLRLGTGPATGGGEGGAELQATNSVSAGGGPGPVDMEGVRSHHGPAAERPELRLGEPESMHCWTGTTCRAAALLACSDWSEGSDVGRSLLDRAEGSGNYGEPGRMGRRPKMCRCRLLNQIKCAIGALGITPRDL
jgi:hypothetical protein